MNHKLYRLAMLTSVWVLAVPMLTLESNNRIVFQSTAIEPVEAADIFIINADGTNFAQLTNTGIAYAPNWSPSGKEIAFITSDPHIETLVAVDVLDLTTNDTTRILDNQEISDEEITFVSLSDIVWSPNGNSIAFRATFQSENCDQMRTSDLYVINIEDGEIDQITNNCATETNLNWHPNGDSILFLSDEQGGQRSDKFHIYIKDLKTGNIFFIENQMPGGEMRSPQWTSDGSRIIFAGFIMNWQFYNVESDSKEVTTPFIEYNLDFEYLQSFDLSPDMRNIALSACNSNQCREEIYILNLETKELSQLTDNDVMDVFPSWQPLSQ